ncbi:MAG TPA: metal-dependent hydrolase [Maritimibacter sp.]|nr:metal-dependent hydrolase [Maritimibacter sp.]
MKLASYNIRKAVGTDRRRDPHRVIEVINSLDADVVVLQEADRRLGPRPTALPHGMLADHTDFVAADLGQSKVSLGWHGNAVLVRKGHRVTRVDRYHLPSLEPRGAVAVEIDNTLTVVGAHLGLRRKNRHEQIRALRGYLAKRTLPSVILGDFNEWSRRRGMEEFAREFELHAPGASYPTFRPTGHLDRIAYSPELTFLHAGVHDTQLARVASDHLPIWVEFDLTQRVDGAVVATG